MVINQYSYTYSHTLLPNDLEFDHRFYRSECKHWFACVGEDVTFSCVTSSFILIWTVTTTDPTIGPQTQLLHISNNPGKFNILGSRGNRISFPKGPYLFAVGAPYQYASINTTGVGYTCLLYTSPSPRDATLSRMPSSA